MGRRLLLTCMRMSMHACMNRCLMATHAAVLGRFLFSLNDYYHKRFGKKYDVNDFHVYEFAKVRPPGGLAKLLCCVLGWERLLPSSGLPFSRHSSSSSSSSHPSRALVMGALLWMHMSLPPHTPSALQVWNCSQEKSNEIVYDFFSSPQFLEGIPPIPGGGGRPGSCRKAGLEGRPKGQANGQGQDTMGRDRAPRFVYRHPAPRSLTLITLSPPLPTPLDE
jgi:hypothetical protein